MLVLRSVVRVRITANESGSRKVVAPRMVSTTFEADHKGENKYCLWRSDGEQEAMRLDHFALTAFGDSLICDRNHQLSKIMILRVLYQAL